MGSEMCIRDRVSNVDDYLEKSPVVRSLTRRVTPAEQQEPKPVQTQGLAHLCVTASGRDRVGLVTQLSKWIYDRGGSITGLKRRGNQTRRHRRGRGDPDVDLASQARRCFG